MLRDDRRTRDVGLVKAQGLSAPPNFMARSVVDLSNTFFMFVSVLHFREMSARRATECRKANC